jgi:hypothetical protein
MAEENIPFFSDKQGQVQALRIIPSCRSGPLILAQSNLDELGHLTLEISIIDGRVKVKVDLPHGACAGFLP